MKLLCMMIWFSLPWAFHPGSAGGFLCVSRRVFLAVYSVPLLTVRQLQRKSFSSKHSSECFQEKKRKTFQIYGMHLTISHPGQRTVLISIGDT